MFNAPIGTLVGRVFRDRIPYFGVRVDTSDPVVAPEVKVRLLLRRYEVSELRLVLRHLNPGLDFVELGAGIGATAAVIGRRLDPSSRLLTFEFRPELLATVRRNLTNGQLIEAAVGVSGSVTVKLPVGAFGSSDSSAHQHGERTVTAPAVRLSEALRDVGIHRFQMLADIEGAEVDLLADDPAALEGCQTAVVELHPGQIGVAEDELVRRFEAVGLGWIEQRGVVHVFKRPTASASHSSWRVTG